MQPEPIDVEIPKSEYPKEALDAGFEGSVMLKIVIDANGRVRSASWSRTRATGWARPP